MCPENDGDLAVEAPQIALLDTGHVRLDVPMNSPTTPQDDTKIHEHNCHAAFAPVFEPDSGFLEESIIFCPLIPHLFNAIDYNLN